MFPRKKSGPWQEVTFTLGLGAPPMPGHRLLMGQPEFSFPGSLGNSLGDSGSWAFFGLAQRLARAVGRDLEGLKASRGELKF